jgi:hypothetical protein
LFGEYQSTDKQLTEKALAFLLQKKRWIRSTVSRCFFCWRKEKFASLGRNWYLTSNTEGYIFVRSACNRCGRTLCVWLFPSGCLCSFEEM